jgi:hypothetical protein
MQSQSMTVMSRTRGIYAGVWLFNSVDLTAYFSHVIPGKKRATLGNPQAIDADGLLLDVDVQSVTDNPSTREDKRQDTDHFFRAAFIKVVNGKEKRYRQCRICPCVEQ